MTDLQVHTDRQLCLPVFEIWLREGWGIVSKLTPDGSLIIVLQGHLFQGVTDGGGVTFVIFT